MARVLLALALLIAAPATTLAQDASQIARVQAGQSCPGCNLFQAELAYRDLPGIDVSGALLRHPNLAMSTINHARFDNSNLSVANIFGPRFTGASIRRTE